MIIKTKFIKQLLRFKLKSDININILKRLMITLYMKLVLEDFNIAQLILY